MVAKGHNPTFSEYCHFAYQIKGSDACSNMVANIVPADLTLGVGSKGQNSTLPEHGHVAYQIKWNRECSNLLVNILPSQPLHVSAVAQW